MDEKAKAVAAVLFKAIEAEGDGRNFYLMAAGNTQDAQAREVFTRLADEELGHQEFLKAQYRAVVETGRADTGLKLKNRSDLSGASPIFSDEFKRRVKEAHFEMSSISIAIHLEMTAMGYYADCAKQVDEPTVKQFFEELADWERGHYNALLRQQEALKEDYWADSGFSPF